MVISRTPPTADLACNSGMCPDWESNWRPFASQSSAQSTEPPQPGKQLNSLNDAWHSLCLNEVPGNPSTGLSCDTEDEWGHGAQWCSLSVTGTRDQRMTATKAVRKGWRSRSAGSRPGSQKPLQYLQVLLMTLPLLSALLLHLSCLHFPIILFFLIPKA